MKFVLLIAFVGCISICSFAQNNYNPKFLIPYNDQGKWGWSDTVGTIAILPEFKSCSLFDRIDNYWVSEVVKKKTKYQYVFDKGILPISNCKIDYQYPHLTDQDYWIIKTKTNRKGIYDWNKKKFVLDTIAESFVLDNNNLGLILYKTAKSKNYFVYNFQSKVSIESSMIDYYWSSETKKTYFRMSEASKDWYDLKPDGNFQHSDDIFSEYYLSYDPFSEIDAPDEQIARNNTSIPPNLKLTDGYSAHSFIEIDQVGYLIFKKEGKFGLMVYSNRKIILEPIFDSIEFDFKNNFFILTNGKKTGIKLVNTIYPTILPKYDSIALVKAIQVNWSWSFMLFEATLNGNKMYVGENGVEYFKP